MTEPVPLLFDAILAQAARCPLSPALLSTDGRAWTYADLRAALEATASRLRDAGVMPSDTVAVAAPDDPDLAIALLGIAACAACAPLLSSLTVPELAATFDVLQPRALVVPAGSMTAAADAARQRGVPILELPSDSVHSAAAMAHGLRAHWTVRPQHDATMLVLQTSGTAGRPTLVRLTHGNVSAASRAIAGTLDLGPADRALSVMPLAHIHGLSAILASLFSGGSVVCTPRFSAPAFFEWLAEWEPTWYTAAPAIHHAVVQEALASGFGGGSLCFVRSASSPLRRDLAEGLERVLGVPVIEAYGMTEASPQIASNRRPPHARKPGSVGKPAGPEVVILAADGSAAPPGVSGEIAIRGANVCVPGWLRTGDAGYVDADGHLFVTGRTSDVINRGGEKIAPLEVESVLLQHPDVADAVAFGVPHQTLGESVAAAVVPRDNAGVSSGSLRAFLRESLAAFKVPHPILIVAVLPTGPTGKLQRRTLASHFGLTTATPGHRATPALTALETTVAGILGEVLGQETLDRHADFFLAGGDSLSATQAIVRLRAACGIDVPLDTLFMRPTVAELAAFLASRDEGRHDASIPAHASGAVIPLTSGQRRLWLLDQLEPGSPAYNMQLALRLTGPLQVAALEAALTEIRTRHDTLRTTFPVVDGQPVQHIAQPVPLRLPVIDLQGSPCDVRESELARVAREAAATPFNLARGPLFQALLVRTDDHAHALLLTMHHIVSDGWSMRVLQRELAALYAAAVAGQPPPLPPLPIQVADVAVWEQDRARTASGSQVQRAYWHGALAGMRTRLDLPADRPRPVTATFSGARLDTTLPQALVDRLRTLGHRHDATLFMTMLAAFQALLMRYTGQEDLAVGTPVAGRHRAELEPLIGFFANTLVMRGDLSGDPPFAELLRRTRRAALGAFAHQDLPFEQVVDAVQPPRHAGRTPLFQVMFAFQNLPDVPGELAPGLVASPLTVEAMTAKFDLTLYVNSEHGALRLGWQYNADLFDAATIHGMAAAFHAVLAHVADDVDCRVSALPLGVADAEPAAHPSRAQGPPLFDERFRAHVARRPGAVAISDEQHTLSYGELDARAWNLAHELRRQGTVPGGRVGVCLTRSTASAVALLAIWRVGGVYVPCDPAHPPERLARLAADARMELLVLDALGRASWPGARVPTVDVDEFAAAASSGSPPRDAEPLDPSAPAYVIYTSGSAGQPKGVVISHANVAHYLGAMSEALGITSTDHYLHTASFAFSSSMRQLLLPLASGAAVTVASTEAIRDPRTLLELVQRERITVLDIVPSYWRALNRTLAAAPPDARAALLDNHVRLLLSASEPLSADLPRTWRGFGHHARLVNMYGQTETTGIVSLYEIGDAGETAASVPIGRPLPGVGMAVRDSAERPVPDGVVGELVVVGRTVGGGYLKGSGASARGFFHDSESGEPGYATGDRARRRRDGTIELLGRLDRQVKLRGFRIDPADIEAELATHPLVHDRAVVMQESESGDERLMAFVVPRDGGPSGPASGEALSASIRTHLKATLPPYLVPAVIEVVDALPLTATGKLDRPALASVPVSTPHPTGVPATQPHAEQLLRELWSRYLGRPVIGVHDNFFDLGGDSLMGLQMIDEANRAGLRLTPAQLFQFQTVAELARASGSGVDVPLRARPAVDVTIHAAPSPAVVRVSIESARAFGVEALTRAGLDEDAAAAMTEVQIEASLRGQPTHNIGAIPRYARRVLTGVINRAPRMRIEHETSTSALLDADNAAGQLAALKAMELAVEKATRSGVGIVGVKGSNHFGAAGHYVWRAARQGLIGLCTTNSALWLAPTGGLTPLFGTNPLGVGVPSDRHHPIVLDVSMSVTAKGKVAMELAEGRTLAPGWILDRAGRTSIDPADLIAGLGVPIGGHKGYGLALTMEILAGVLTGAGFAGDHRRDRLKRPGAQADFGHCFIALDPGLFMTRREFAARIDRLIDEIKHAQRLEGVDEILLPGEAEMRAREQNLRRGLPVSASVQRTLEAYRVEAGLSTHLIPFEELAGA